MPKLFSKLLYYLRLLASELIFFPFINLKYTCEKHGESGADWWIPKNSLTRKSIVYSAGVGTNISFDVSLINTYGLKVFAYDPTPKAVSYVEDTVHGKIPNFVFIPVGLWNSNTFQKFFVPQNTSDTSHSIVNLQKTNEFFVAQCVTLKTIMKLLKHTNLDLLKIDIEGAEFTVLKSMLNDGIIPKVLCVEFDQPASLLKIINMTKIILDHNYTLVKKDFFNFTFLQK
ncbi:MAG: FkbM family methyltransferase [Microgenomates group bacterium]